MMKKNTNNYSEFDLNSLLKPYVSRWYWFLVGVFISIFLVFLYIKSSTPVYNIKSAVLIKDAKKSSIGVGDVGVLEGLSGFGGMSTNSIENELEVFVTKKLARDVVFLNHLQTSIFFDKGFRSKKLYSDTSPYSIIILNGKRNKKFADLQLYVTKSNFTNRKLIEFANDSVESGKLENVAFVLNGVTKQNFGYGNKYG